MVDLPAVGHLPSHNYFLPGDVPALFACLVLRLGKTGVGRNAFTWSNNQCGTTVFFS
jgi:hypothetical protein